MALILLTFVATNLRSRSGVIMSLRAPGNKQSAWPEPASNLGRSEPFLDAQGSDRSSPQICCGTTNPRPLGEGRRSKVPLSPTPWRCQSKINEEAYEAQGLGGKSTASFLRGCGRALAVTKTPTQVHPAPIWGQKWEADFPLHSPAPLRCPGPS